MRKATLLHTILWRGVQMSFSIYLQYIFRITTVWKARPPKKGGYLLVANHSNRNDPFMIGVRLRTPINYMANLEGVSGGQKFFSNGIGCFNIKKGRADMQAFMQAIKLIKGGYSVGIFPEGDRSWLGETVPFSSAIPSLAKKMNVPVLMANVSGNYLSCPRWNEQPRTGKVFITFDLISQEQVKAMSKNELHEAISAYIYNDDFSDERLENITFKGKDVAVGIENLLWKCPKCSSEDGIVGEGDNIKCSKCSAVFAINANQRVKDDEGILSGLKINHVKDWFNWQLAALENNIESSGVSAIVEDSGVELIEESDGEWNSLGKGTLTLTKDSLSWSGENLSELVFDKKEVLNIVDNFNQYAILNLSKSRYRIYFNDTCSLKWTTALKSLGE